MSEPAVDTHHLKCSEPSCKTQAIVTVYSCGCRRVDIMFPSKKDNSCMIELNKLRYTAKRCEGAGAGRKFAENVATEVLKSLAVNAILAAISGGSITKV